MVSPLMSIRIPTVQINCFPGVLEHLFIIFMLVLNRTPHTIFHWRHISTTLFYRFHLNTINIRFSVCCSFRETISSFAETNNFKTQVKSYNVILLFGLKRPQSFSQLILLFPSPKSFDSVRILKLSNPFFTTSRHFILGLRKLFFLYRVLFRHCP